jgi:hypothetical protein
VPDADDDFARRLRRGSGADRGASGAARAAGSRNFKEKYAPTYPVVEAVHIDPGKVVTRAELEALGVVAPAGAVTPTEVRTSGKPRGRHALKTPDPRRPMSARPSGGS